MDRHSKKRVQRYIAWGCCGLIVVLLAVLPMAAGGGEPEVQASVLSAQVERQDIQIQLMGGGQLEAEAALTLDIPQEVKLTKYLVHNGDQVSQGDAIAQVDTVSVMSAITQVQQTLDYLSQQISAAANESAPQSVTALVSGRVKQIYAQEGDSVSDVMLRYGALAVLSLDDQLAVSVQTQSALTVGAAVTVTLSDGTQVPGSVKSNVQGSLTVTLEDAGYALGQQVTLQAQDGTELGSGQLEIHSPYAVMAYSGVVDTIAVEEEQMVSQGRTLITLEDTGTAPEYQQLLDQREQYEQQMQQLFQMYQTQTVTAPCDGIITGVDEDGAWLLSAEADSWIARLLSWTEPKEGFLAVRVQVEQASQDALVLTALSQPELVTDIRQLSASGEEALDSWNYSGPRQVYTQASDGLLQIAGTAQPGEKLVLVGTQDQPLWLVRGEQTENALVLLSAGGEEPEPSEGEDPEPPEGEDPEPPEGENPEPPEGEDPQPSTPPQQTQIQITPQSLPQAAVGQDYSLTFQAWAGDSAVSGTWQAEGLPAGWTLDSACGTLSGTGQAAGSYSLTVRFVSDSGTGEAQYTLVITGQQSGNFRGYVARVVQAEDGRIQVLQTPYSYAISDLNALPQVSANTAEMTVEAVYDTTQLSGQTFAPDQLLLLVVDEKGTLTAVSPVTESSAGQMPGGIQGGFPGAMGSQGGMGGGSQETTFELYSLDTVTVASVTSQSHMTVEISVDEQDISQVFLGQQARITIDALGGESFAAGVTKIAATGENAGGSSKFTVTLTLEKSGQMLPGMTACAWIDLDGRQSVLCLPAAAVEQVDGQSVVYTGYDQATAQLTDPVTVCTGASDGETVEILSGAQEDMTVYYAYYEGTQLTPAP